MPGKDAPVRFEDLMLHHLKLISQAQEAVTRARRYAARSPASEMILDPWNSSLRRRSKSTCKGAHFASPIGHAMTEPQHRHNILILISESLLKGFQIAIYLGNSG